MKEWKRRRDGMWKGPHQVFLGPHCLRLPHSFCQVVWALAVLLASAAAGLQISPISRAYSQRVELKCTQLQKWKPGYADYLVSDLDLGRKARHLVPADSGAHAGHAGRAINVSFTRLWCVRGSTNHWPRTIVSQRHAYTISDNLRKPRLRSLTWTM